MISARLEDLNQDGGIDMHDPARLYIIALGDHTLRRIDPVATTESMLTPSWSPSGHHIAYANQSHTLVLISSNDCTESARFKNAMIMFDGDYHWSPDGTKIAYIGGYNPPDSVHRYDELFIYDLETGLQERLTDTHTRTVFGTYERNGIQLEELVWSPDGQYIALVWRTHGERYLVVVCIDGSKLTQITKLEAYYRFVAWGSD